MVFSWSIPSRSRRTREPVFHPQLKCAETRAGRRLSHWATAFGLLVSGLGASACAGSGQRQCSPHAAAPHHHGAVSPAGVAPSPPEAPAERHAIVIPHAQLESFENNGNSLTGIATSGLGARAFEVWRSKVVPGSQTPPHVHETEEIFVFLEGRGRAIIGDQSLEFEAPATVIAPAHVQHQFFNTGSVPTDAIVIVGIGSAIRDANGTRMDLPWRK